MVRISLIYARGLSLRVATAAAILFVWSATANALDFSVPYVRQGLSYYGPNGKMSTGIAGYGATVGQLENRAAYGENAGKNGIDGFDGHRHVNLGPNPGDAGYGLYGYQDVKDFSNSGAPAPSASDNSSHGTYVAGIMAMLGSADNNGTAVPFLGMAPAARYYGAIFNGDESSAGYDSLNNALKYLTIDQNVSTVNSSWGWNSPVPRDGSSTYSRLMDEYVGYQGKSIGGTVGTYLDKLMVVAAGNTGGAVLPPADSFNGLSVGALDAVDSAATGLFNDQRMPAPRVASFSARSPLYNGRSGIDVVAPGTALYSTYAINVARQNGWVNGPLEGTSLAAPHVTGEAALLYGVASQRSTSNKATPFSTDHKLMKALIINSADKIAGLDTYGASQDTWQPGKTTTINGITNAIVPLNYAVGAGSANANEAYLQYCETGNRFWDLYTLSTNGAHQYYTLGTGKFVSSNPGLPLLASLTATLIWDRHLDFDYASNENVVKDLLSDLNLTLQKEVAPGDWRDVYMSAGTGDNVEHIYLPELSGTENYRLDVYANNLAEPNLGEQYALAVSFATVPEPSTLALLAVGSLGLSIVAWRRSRSSRKPLCRVARH